MNTTNQQNENKPTEEEKLAKTWGEILNEFIKNPASTFTMGGIGTNLLNKYFHSVEVQSLKEEHQLQLQEKDKQINKLIDHIINQNNKLQQSAFGLPETIHQGAEHLEQDQGDKVYRPKRKSYLLK